MLKRFVPIFAKITQEQKKTFLLKRLPIYIFGLAVLLIFGVKGLMFTFLMCLAFVLGWTLKGMILFFRDYRLSLRLNRVYFSQVDYQNLQKHNSMLRDAIKSYQATAKGGPPQKGAVVPPIGEAPQTRYTHEQIMKMMSSMSGEVEG